MEILIVDDEPLARARLRRLLATYPDARLAGEADSAAGLREQIARHAPDLVILDIEMPGEDGLSAAHWLAGRADPPAVIFVTAHPNFALEAFSTHADGYLLKPVSTEQLHAAIDAARRPTRAARAGTPASAPDDPLVAVAAGRRTRLLHPGEIIALRAEDKGVTVFTRNGPYFVDGSLKELEVRLDAAGFLRVHRAWLVARASIRALERDAIGRHWLEVNGLPEPVPVSRRQLPGLQERLRH
ncbi:response regulator transcription factor [Pseudothauera nasutitermitis]|uniref:Response regulator transcription factor n=1 Tax=Pseudothauera nasutitermitis TaxID=2565930 RepID=A0A4S4B2S3_9RHOO|nr:response regulator transcription factor [Pseudothauera nasutitermitis]